MKKLYEKPSIIVTAYVGENIMITTSIGDANTLSSKGKKVYKISGGQLK